MTYDLYIGDRTFSSWSLRGWLMFEKFGLSFNTHDIGLYGGTMAEDLAPFAPARLVPMVRTPEGDVIGETIAMAETLAERHPDAGHWPKDARQRTRARWLCAEMASGFGALRRDCPMQLEHVYGGFRVPEGVRADLDRIETLWAWARNSQDIACDWLFGDYSLADVFYAPVAARIIGYDLPVSAASRSYCMQVISDPAFKAWRAEGLKQTYDPSPYPMSLPTVPWPE
ncbi:glutathione S-transferase [uncultured Roseobacter sp.]|uniref:glutathione S-transferase n=1 Tax=uncultured Roseobacter sp. TaxID=114847 RepID=UPI00260D687E|nr:glutathione S-transferase [uncultured Roseobacter sp.]